MIDFVHLFSGIPKEIATFFIAMLPIGELRASIPIALGVYNLSWSQAFFWSVLGNIIPVVLILLCLEPLSWFLSKHFKIFERFFLWLFAWTRKKHNHRFEKWGAVTLIAFVAIPLPMTGGWTGAVAAFVFGIPFRKSLPLIFSGILIAGIIVTLTSLGVSFSFNFLNR
ncbi:MAG: small multi-drug export protein [Patescibacteria group bacterium]